MYFQNNEKIIKKLQIILDYKLEPESKIISIKSRSVLYKM